MTVKVNVVDLMMDIRDKIHEGKLASLREINAACDEHRNELELWEFEWLRGNALGSYIIWCEVIEKIPVSGY